MLAPSGVKLAMGLVFMLIVTEKLSVLCKVLPCYGDPCECTVGYIKDIGSCRLPRRNEPCIESVGCLEYFCVNNRCQCQTSHYFDISSSKCTPRLGHSSPCNATLSPCISGLSCISDKINQKRCLCDPINSSFWTAASTCQPVSSLMVSPTAPPSGRKTTSIELNWSQPVSPVSSSLQYYTVGDSTSTEGPTLTTSSHKFTNLIPGTEYSLSIKTVLRGDPFYPERSTSSLPRNLYTFPAHPGPVDESKSSLITPPYYVTFGASVGNVDLYRFSITPPTIDGQSTFTLTTGTTTPTLNLNANTAYQYQIIAIRGLDESEPRIGTFSTDSSRSGPVSNLSVTPQEDSATIRWRQPYSPNGVLTGYSVQVNKNDACQYILLVQCENCNISGGCEIERTDSYKDVDLSTTIYFELNLPSLDPYQEYTAIVSAFNEKGQGTPYPQRFQTLVAAPQEIKSVTLTPLGKDPHNEVYLKINWTPGKFTGPTNFTLKILRETSLNSGKYEVASTIHVEGYKETEYTKSDVLAYWNYQVAVQAVTEKRSSGFVNRSTKTQPSVPGKIGGLHIDQDPRIAAKINMKFECPVETERNGKDLKFEIERVPSFTTQINRFVNARDCFGQISNADTDVSVGTNYTYKVRFVNHEYAGQFIMSSPVYLIPKVPVLDTVAQVFNSPSESKEQTESTVEIGLKANDLRDISKKQGTISNIALIVCTKSMNNSCNNGIPKRTKRSLTAGELGTYYTYNEARNDGFSIPYRATPDDWHIKVLSGIGSSYSYTVGSETNCPTSPRTYCNGPLPDEKDFVFFLAVCNAAGCVDYKSDGVYKSEVNPEEDTNIGVIVGAVVGIILVIALVVVLIVFVMRRRRGRPQTDTSTTDPEPVNVTTKKRPVKIREFKQHVRRFHEDQNLLFDDEFFDLKNESLNFNNASKKVTRNGKEAKDMSHNASGRMEAMTDCDETMMLLKANYITGINSLRDYIATQNPMPQNIPDFWRMILEKNCKVIVMLSDLTPQTPLYWPENLNENIRYGDFTVNMTHCFDKKKCIIRRFKVSLGNVTSLVSHLCLPGWYYFSETLTTNDVIEFARQVRRVEVTPGKSGPIVVHCSAGVGPTGVFIALDYFLQYLDKNGLDAEIDIYNFVLEMRRRRPRMVQTEAQYILIFDALAEAIANMLERERRCCMTVLILTPPMK